MSKSASKHAKAAASVATAPPDIVTESSSMEVESMNGGTPTPIAVNNNKSEHHSNGNDDPQTTTDNKDAITAKPSSTSKNGQDDAAAAAPTARKRRSIGTASAINKTYIQLVQEAIVDMKDRTGSSLPAIKGWLGNHYSDLAAHPQFARNINKAIKNGLEGKPPKFEKVRQSYKISREFREAERNKRRRLNTAKAAVAKKKKEEAAVKRKKEALQKKLDSIPPEEAQAIRKRREEEQKRKAAAEKKAKERADRLRRRRFPMEDTKLHQEDKQLNVKPPAHVQARPYLPFFWQATVPLQHPSRQGKTSDLILRNSKVEALHSDTRGVVPDLLAVYHFFRGDVHFTLSGSDDDESPEHRLVPEFELRHLMFAVEQVMNGNARKAKLVPPLLVHLFVTCLQILCAPLDDDGDDNKDYSHLSKNEQQLRNDLSKYLLPALTPASWADVLQLYMDAMERYYNSDASRDPSVLQPLPTDIKYLLGRTDKPVTAVPATPKPESGNADPALGGELAAASSSHPLPDGYYAYCGDPNGALARAYFRLMKSDPWSLSAEELLALLRALTDDVLATHPAASRDLANREAEMQELLRNKRAADMKFRKVRLAFEGPKKPPPAKSKAKEGGDGAAAGEDGKQTAEEKEDSSAEGDDNNEDQKPFKPTATKKQFEAAKKAQEKANDAYEKGIRNLVARTEPVGYDRNFNAVYCFRHDPEMLYVEDKKPPAPMSSTEIPTDMLFARYSWHVIETTSLFDQYVASLDVRGRREHNLYEELVGPTPQLFLRRHLHDNLKEEADARAKIREMESLKERLKAAQIKCDEEQGRRSGRLAGQAELELIQIESEIDALEMVVKGKSTPQTRDYQELTGLDALKSFELAGRAETRRTREQKAMAKSRKLPLLRCGKLVSTGHIDGTGLVGMLVSSMLDLEEHCESLVPWERQDTTRDAWIARLESAVSAWNSITDDHFASLPVGSPPVAAAFADDESSRSGKRRESPNSSNAVAASTASKRRKHESPAPSRSSTFFLNHSVSTILTMLKLPLLELEERVGGITNVVVSTADRDLADDNMSTDSAEEDQAKKERLEQAWKKLIYKVKHTTARRHTLIRELLVSAIGAARKAHLPQVVAELRAALLQFHPGAAGDAKAAAIKVLEANGGYEDDEDDESDAGEDEANEESKEDAAVSVLSAEAIILRSSLDGTDDFGRADWINEVKQVKSLSRLASLTAGFTKDAMGKLEKLEVERDALTNALQAWCKTEEFLAKQRDGKKSRGRAPKELVGPSEVWANVSFTDDICMAKAEDFPWWPAKRCEAKDLKIAESLSSLGRCLVAFIGEMGGLRVVKSDDIKPFTGKAIEEGEDVQHSKKMLTDLDDCMAMARRILRGRSKRKTKK